MKKILSLFIIYIFNCLPIKKNKVFLFSYYGSQYGCNPKYIADYMVNNDPHKKFDVVWAFNNYGPRRNLGNVRRVKTMSLKYFYELCTAKVVITNYRTTDLFVKRKKQYYIQTWHSSLRLKQIEKDAEYALPRSYVQMAKNDSLKCDLLLSGCKFSTDIFKRAFWYGGEIFEHGTPRNDLLLLGNPNKREEVLKKLMISPSSKVLLYAPTFRKDHGLEFYDLNYPKLVEELKRKFGGEWVVLVKLHPHLESKANQIVYGENVINVTSYDDIQELLLSADILISDYSSLIFDFSITNRPCFLYIPDLVEYTGSDRKLYFDIAELPFISARTNSNLLEKINQFDVEVYEERLQKFLKQIGSYEEGKASECLLKRIDDVCFSKGKEDIYEAI